MKRKTVVIVPGAAIAGIVFGGVALSLDGTDARVRPTPEEAAEAIRKVPGTKEKAHAAPRVDGQTWGLRSYSNVRGDLFVSRKTSPASSSGRAVSRQNAVSTVANFSHRVRVAMKLLDDSLTVNSSSRRGDDA